MQQVPNRNAQVIIPFVIVVWLLGVVVFAGGVPPVLEALFVVLFAIAVPVMVFYLMGEAGWRKLARRFRQKAPFTGEWRICPTGQMALVSVDHPQFQRVKMRFVSALRVAATEDALHLSTIFSPLPVLGWFFPPLEIPWTAFASARPYEAQGWVKPPSEPGALLQLSYDPNYTGTFVELQAGDPPVFIQLPAPLLSPGLSQLGIDA